MKLVVILFLAVLLVVVCSTKADSGHPQVVAVHKSSESEGEGHSDGEKHNEQKHLKQSERVSSHDVEKARKGESFKDLRKIDDEEKGGKKTVHHAKGSHKSYKKSGGSSAHGAKFQEGSKRKKNNFKKGFREKYHRDEEKNHDSFYSNAHKSGEYKVFGKKHAKHSAQSSAKKIGGNHKKVKSENNHAKASKKAGGHNVEDQKGYQGQKQTKSHHEHGGKYAKKSSNSGGKQFHYNFPHH